MNRRKSKKKRRKLKLFLLTALVVVLTIAGYILYEFKFKTYDVADENVDAILDEGYLLTLPDGSTVQVGVDGTILQQLISGEFKVDGEDTYVLIENNQVVQVRDANGEEIEHSSIKPHYKVDKMEDTIIVFADDGNKITVVPDSSNNTPSKQNPTVASVKEKYTPSFKALEAQAETKIISLVSRAQAEYNSKKAEGESISFGYFYNKYMAAASEMEASTDAAFENLMRMLEEDLVHNGYNKSYAVSFRNEYEASKEALRSELYSKALNMK